MARSQNSDPRLILALMLFILGGTAGVAALGWIMLNRAGYEPHNPPAARVVLANTVGVGVSILFYNLMISQLMMQASPGFLFWLGFPVGILITKTLLTDKNIHWANNLFWDGFKQTLFVPNSSENASSQTTQSQALSSPQLAQSHPAISSQPIEVDRRGDGIRITFIGLAFFLLLIYLGSQYFFNHQSAIEDRLNRVIIETEMAESL